MKATIIAVGNGGYNLASDIIKANIFPDSKFIVCDTDERNLEESSKNADETFLLDKIHANTKTRSYLLSGIVEDIIVNCTDTVIVCATYGGLTGSKYAPLIALEAILKGKFVCSIFSMSFSFEGTAHANRAFAARMQTVASSNLVFQQNNDRLKVIDSLGLEEMNKPLVETVSNAVTTRSLAELSLSNDLDALIPKMYNLPNIPLLWLRSNCYRGIENSDRIELFDSLA